MSGFYELSPLIAQIYNDFTPGVKSVEAFVDAISKSGDLESSFPAWVASSGESFVVSYDGENVGICNAIVEYCVHVLNAPPGIKIDDCVIPQVSFPPGFIDRDMLSAFRDNSVDQILASLEEASRPVPQPSVQSAPSISTDEVPDVNGKDELFINFNVTQANVTNELNAFLSKHGYDAFASVIAHNGWKVLKEKFVYNQEAGQALTALMATKNISFVEVVTFFDTNCSSMNMELSQNHYSTVRRSSDCVKIVGSKLITPTHIFRFDTPYAERLRPTEQPILFNVVGKILELPIKVSGCIVSYEMQIALAAMYLVALLNNEGKLVVKEPHLSLDGSVVFRETAITTDLTAASTHPKAFHTSGALGRVAYCVKNMVERKLAYPVFSYCGARTSAAQLHFNFNALNIDEKCGFQLALTRCRQSRVNTLLDEQYKGCYVLLELADGEYVPYDPTYVRMFHILYDILKYTFEGGYDTKSLLINLGSKKDLVLVDYIIEFAKKNNYVIKFTNNFGKLIAYQDYVVDDDYSDYIYVDLNNPKNQNDYIIQKPGGLPDSEFTMRAVKAKAVYALISWASRVTYSVDKASLRLLRGDVTLPTSKLLVKSSTGYHHWTVPGFVPIGHHPHTVQRVLTWKQGSSKVMVGVDKIESNDIVNYPQARLKDPGYSALVKYQIPETLVMSQQRCKLMPCYSSDQIKSLKLSPRREDKVAQVASVTEGDGW